MSAFITQVLGAKLAFVATYLAFATLLVGLAVWGAQRSM